MYVFAYGSLLDPASLSRTVPGVDLAACVPARLHGFTRAFSVAFRNDGTHQDKRYVDASGAHPPIVLFCDLVRAADRFVNGVCVPVDDTALAQLQARELRYEALDVTAGVRPLNSAAVATEVHVFVGREIHRSPEDVAAGVLAAHYLASIQAGAAHWDAVAPGFFDEFQETTQPPDASIVHALTRIDG